MTKSRFYLFSTALIALSMLLGACAGAATPVATEAPADPPAEPTALPPTEAPTEAPTAPPVEAASPDDLDAAYDVFLADMEAYNTISLEALNERMIEEPPPFLLDVRQPEEVGENGYISTSVNIPLRELGENLEALPGFDTTIVSYCGSGWRCTIALTALEAMGWQDVLGLKGGSFTGWVDAGYPVETGAPPAPDVLSAVHPDPGMAMVISDMLASIPDGWGVITVDGLNTELVENEDLVVIDVRRSEEVEEKGSIDAPNQLHIPLEEFIAMRGEWPDLDTPIVIYCGSGHRSTIAMAILWSYGYTDVHSMKGGFSAWAEAGYPVMGGAPDLDAAYSAFLEDMEAYNTISLESLNEMLIEEPPPYVLDVRQPEELEANGHIQGAVNIPLREVAENIQVLPDFDTTIVSYCGSGWRCTIAMTALEALGWKDVLSLKGGSFGGWVEAGYPVEEGLAPDPLVLDVASPDPALLAVIDETLSSVPDGFGVITAEGLNAALVENPDLVLIDVRRLEEVEENGVIESANYIHIPLEEFIAMKGDWPSDLDTPVAIYCGSGHRSTIAMTILWSYGYPDVHSLKGGFSAWAEAGYPVVEFVPAPMQ
jgi:rhodanese-related sulfurtransferase